MSGRDDEHGDYPIEDPRWEHNRGADDSLNPTLDLSALETSALETPVDLAAVQADDALLNMLSGGADPGTGNTDAELTRVLVAWRRDVDSEPFGDLVDPDTATDVIAASRRRPAPRRHPLLGTFAAAAAVLVIMFSGVGLVAKSAEPGDRLWSLTKVLYTDYARSVEAAEDVRDELSKARTALNEGRDSQAEESLKRIQQQLSEVNEDQNHTALAGQYEQLEKQLQQRGVGEGGRGPLTTTPPPATASSEPAVPPVPPSESSAPTTESTPPSESPSPPTEPSTLPSISSVPPEPEPRSSEPTPGTGGTSPPGASGTVVTSQPGGISSQPGTSPPTS